MRIASVLALVLTLVACGSPSEAYNQVNVFVGPKVSVSSTSAPVGTFMDVTIEMLVNLDYRSPFPQRSTRFSMGACMFTNVIIDGDRHCVPWEPYSSPDSVQIAAGDLQSKMYSVTLQRGELRVITHSFRFTSDQAGNYYLMGIVQGEVSDQGSIGFGGNPQQDYIVVRFE